MGRACMRLPLLLVCKRSGAASTLCLKCFCAHMPLPHRAAPVLLQAFPREYTRDLKNQMLSEGRIAPTGCPELPL